MSEYVPHTVWVQIPGPPIVYRKHGLLAHAIHERLKRSGELRLKDLEALLRTSRSNISNQLNKHKDMFTSRKSNGTKLWRAI